MSQFFELHYHLPEDPARLFDVAQGLAGRRSVLKRGGTVKVKPFTETCRRLLFQCIAFAVLTALAAVLVWALHAKLKVLFFLCLVMSLVTFWTYQAGRMGYRKSWTQFREGNRPDGTVTFTASGIREWNASDHTERFTWEQWDCCIISQEVIVLTFHQPMLVLLPYTQESESTTVLSEEFLPGGPAGEKFFTEAGFVYFLIRQKIFPVDFAGGVLYNGAYRLYVSQFGRFPCTF